MKNRCTNPKNPVYENYGKRGIGYCRRWAKFENFLEDMGVCPDGLEIERVDNDKGYFLGNCKWDTSANQNRNKRGCVKVKLGNSWVNLYTEAKAWGVPGKTVRNRLKQGWSVEDALTTPQEYQPRIIHFRGMAKNLSEWARHIGIKTPVLWGRLKRGWSIEKALTTALQGA